MIARTFGLVTVAWAVVSLPISLTGQRQRFSMDPGWRFNLGDSSGAEQPRFDDHLWRRVDLPHDWSIEGTPREDAPGGGRVGFFPTGIGWYRKAFRLPAGSRGRMVKLAFDGVYMNSDVWINGHYLGHRPYGYIGFEYDLTPFLIAGVNVVAVRVDNGRQPNSRWYTGSGIYRHVWLTLEDAVHIGHWGVWVTTPTVDSSGAEVMTRTTLENRRTTAWTGALRSVVVDAEGREVSRGEAPVRLAPGDTTQIEQRMTVPAPRLWSIEEPDRYTLRSELVEGARTVDTMLTAFGIRTIAFDKDQGFLLNGKRVKLRGVNLHHDGGMVGAAVPEAVWERRLRRLKAMGANAIRTSHNPPAPEFLDLCDRLGFVVMAEAFDEWTIGKVPEGYHNYFAEWSERDLTDYVRWDRNHPSIVLWSAGNEIGEQSTPTGADVLRRLVALFHREDPTRPVTTGNDQIYADGHPATLAFLSSEDIVGYNYVDRWRERRELFAEPDREAHPDWKMVGTESGTLFQSIDERYSLGDDATTPHPNYTSGMMEAERLWKWVTLHDYFAGDFMWTGMDYLGESFWPFKGFASGALDITGQPKDAFYLYQSLWGREPMLHLFPHWNWPGREGQVIPVLAYTSCSSVELFLNGRSLGEKRLEFPAQGTSGGWNTYALPVVHATTNDLHLSWDVPYEPGVLRAVGRTRNGHEACHDEIRTAGPAAALRLATDRDTVTTRRGDVAQIEIQVVDSAGTVLPTAEPPVRVQVGGGTLLGLDNANLQDHDSYQANPRRLFNGRGFAVVRPVAAGAMRITATSPGLASAALQLVVLSAPFEPAIPDAR